MTRRGKQSPEYVRIKELVVQILSSYKDLNGLIKAAQRHAHGNGLIRPDAYKVTADCESSSQVIYDGMIVPSSAAQMKAMQSLAILRNQKQTIEESLDLLREYNEKFEVILRTRYIEGKTVVQVCSQLAISDSTYDYWQIEAIKKFAMYAGISSGGTWFISEVASVG